MDLQLTLTINEIRLIHFIIKKNYLEARVKK